MAIRNIVTVEDPVLRKTSRKVEKFDEKLAMLLDDMKSCGRSGRYSQKSCHC